MYDLGKHIQDVFDQYSNYTPQELVDYSSVSSIALDHEIAFQVCGQQILAALELGDEDSAKAYIAIRSELAKCAFGLTKRRPKV